ncbi:MAG: hypothetical protein KAT57_13135 [Candidatus Lokiarchaeota archaeon]|nr:hypothetical protein [Candidatus Lokiarchaeota archaeon]
MYKNRIYNNKMRPQYNINCLIALLFSKIKTLNLSILSKMDKTRKKATIVIEKANGFPNVNILIQDPGRLIAVIKTSE